MTSVGLAELMSVFSLGADAGLGEPLESGQRTALLAVALASAAGLPEVERRDAYYLGLLKYIGCVADVHLAADFLGGDEKRGRTWFALIDWGKPADVLVALAKNIAREESFSRRAAKLARSLRTAPRMPQMAAAHCEVASMLARDCGCPPGVIRGLHQVYERWNGKGIPHQVRGEAIEPAMRVVHLAADVELFARAGGVGAAVAVARARRGSRYDPRLVDVFARHADALVATLTPASLWDAVIAAEPGAPDTLSGDRLEQALRAMAGFADLPSRWTRGHSLSVAALAQAAGERLGLEEGLCTRLRHAGYLHDLGSVGLPSAIWEKPGPLTEAERERVRLHPYFTERMLARPSALAAIGELAAMDHERLDGSGYHRRLPASTIPLPARVLAAADVYVALLADRPHRPALLPAAAADVLATEVRAGRLDARAVSAVLEVSGQAVAAKPAPALPQGLSEREAEVLAWVAVGMTNKEVARRLGISDRTVGHHLQHVYDKIGVSTRSAAALFAQQHGLVRPGAVPHRG